MSNSSPTHAVNGNTDNALIAESFANYFSRVCTPNCAVQNTKLYDIFVHRFEHYVGADMAVDVNSQTVHEIISKLKPGKAPSGDGIMNMYSYYLTYTCKAL